MMGGPWAVIITHSSTHRMALILIINDPESG